MKEIVNKLVQNIKVTIISTLRQTNVLSPKLSADYENFEKYLNDDENNIFTIIDVLAYAYLFDDTSLENNDNLKLRIPQTLLDVIITMLNESKNDIKLSNSEKIAVDYVKSVVLSTLNKILEKHHKVIISFPKDEYNENKALVLLLVEYLYRHYFVNLPEINSTRIKKCIIDNGIKRCSKNTDIMRLVVNCANTIKKRGNGKTNKTTSTNKAMPKLEK